MDSTTDTIESFVKSEYKYGFVSEIETEAFPPGLSEAVVRRIAQTKGEPDFMLDWRLKAYRHWQTMEEPHWANVNYPPINYQDYIYYAVPKPKKKLGSLDEVDPEVRAMFEKLGISLDEQQRLGGHDVPRGIGQGGRHLLLLHRGGQTSSRPGQEVFGHGRAA
jgi:Fe-S cluster assembly protein SufB